jgi:hypothetical protein
MSAQSLATISLVQDEPLAEVGLDQQINVTVDDANDALTVTVSPRVLALNPNPSPYTITWILSQNADATSWSIDSISGIPVDTDPQGNWTCQWTNALGPRATPELYSYTIGLTKTFKDPLVTANISIDPVIENDPPPHFPDGDGKY